MNNKLATTIYDYVMVTMTGMIAAVTFSLLHAAWHERQGVNIATLSASLSEIHIIKL